MSDDNWGIVHDGTYNLKSVQLGLGLGLRIRVRVRGCTYNQSASMIQLNNVDKRPCCIRLPLPLTQTREDEALKPPGLSLTVPSVACVACDY